MVGVAEALPRSPSGVRELSSASSSPPEQAASASTTAASTAIHDRPGIERLKRSSFPERRLTGGTPSTILSNKSTSAQIRKAGDCLLPTCDAAMTKGTDLTAEAAHPSGRYG
ncbi:hypothetical protein Kisp01_17490 [Kineosporia sp. NBRC 101677]|nr:hypothetical protein Kisp01_17490 [Kineosporia sp. NBRC 101677]